MARGSSRIISIRWHRPAWFRGASRRGRRSTRGRLGHGEPLESVGRVNLQEKLEGWAGRGVAWLLRKLMASALRNAVPVSARRPDVSRSPIPLHRDPWCGTYVSPEISIPLEQQGRTLHFCSAECRAQYLRSSGRAASA